VKGVRDSKRFRRRHSGDLKGPVVDPGEVDSWRLQVVNGTKRGIENIEGVSGFGPVEQRGKLNRNGSKIEDGSQPN